MVLSGDLFIEPGAELNFSNNSFLIVKGNVNIQGTDNEKVIFNSLDSSWKGAFFLCNTKKRSFINNLVIKGAQSTETGILKLTGGFTILGADIQINNLSIYATKAEDAINIVNSKVDIKNLKIIDAVSDGLDCDFCKGEIKNSSANSINGDAFDFSGSDILMTDIVAREIKDKALSAGEDSKIVLRNSLFSDIGVGLASKDSSVVLAENIFIKNFNLYAAMTYQKKPIFDVNSSMEIIGSQVVGDDPYKRQFGTTLLVDNSLIVESALDIETLYSEGIMKK